MYLADVGDETHQAASVLTTSVVTAIVACLLAVPPAIVGVIALLRARGTLGTHGTGEYHFPKSCC